MVRHYSCLLLLSLLSLSPKEEYVATRIFCYTDLNIEIPEAVDILKVVECANKFKGAEGPSGVLRGAQNVWDMLSDEQSLKHITTGSGDLNNILGGGIHCKEVTEIATGLISNSSFIQAVFQESVKLNWAINVQIPVEYGGLGAKAVYIDTEGSFMVEPVYQIAEGCISDILEYFPYSMTGLHLEKENCSLSVSWQTSITSEYAATPNKLQL